MLRIHQTEDLEIVMELDRTLFPGEAMRLDEAEASNWWVAYTQDGTPVAYAGLSVPGPQKWGFLSRAGVLPVARGGGLQKRLIRVRERWARAHGLTHTWTYVATFNVPSQRSLIGCGYLPYRYVCDAAFAGIYFKRSLTG